MATFVDCWNKVSALGLKHGDGSPVLGELDRDSILQSIRDHVDASVDPLQAARNAVQSHLDETLGHLRSIREQAGVKIETKTAKPDVAPPDDISAGPGAASPGDFPKESPVAQLSETIKAIPPAPLLERMKAAVDIGEQWAAGKDAVVAGMAKAKAIAETIKDSYLNLPKWDDFQAAIGRWTGADSKASFEVNQFLKDINSRVPSKLKQEAITNWIQADGDEALLAKRAAASKPDVKPGYEEALKLSEDEKTIARNIQSYFESRLNDGIESGVLKSGVENYVNQIWKDSNPVTNKLQTDLFGAGNLNPSFKFAKQRIFDSYFEGEQAGFNPKNKSIASLLGAYDQSFNRALSARALIKDIQRGTAEDGKPIAITSGNGVPVPAGATTPDAFLVKPNTPPEGAVAADGRPYKPIDHWALRDWKWATSDSEGKPILVQGDMLIHPDYYNHLNNVLKTSSLQQPKGIGLITAPLLKASAFLKQTKLSLSGFHLTQEALHGVFHKINPANLTDINFADPIQKGLVEHGLMISDPRAQQMFAEGLSGGGLVNKIPGLGWLQAKFNDWLFKDYIPQLKMTMATDALERNRKVYADEISSGKVTDSQIQALTARQANAAFGELNYRQMGRDPTVQDMMRLGLLAPDFLEARSRFVGQALKPYGHEQRIALALMGATLYVTGRVLNQYLDGDPHYDKPFAVFHDGKEYRLRTVLGDIGHLITDPRNFAYNRLSVIGRGATEFVTGRDDKGIKRTGYEQLKDLASWLMPISVEPHADKTTGQKVAASMGLASRTYGNTQQAYELADKFMASSDDPKVKAHYEQTQKETHPDSPYRPLRTALLMDKPEDAAKAYDKLLELHTPQQIRTAMIAHKPFTGTAELERKFKESLSDSQLSTYSKAMVERSDLARKFIQFQQSHQPSK